MSARKVGILAVTLLAMAALLPAGLLFVKWPVEPAAEFEPSLRAMLPMEAAPLQRAAQFENRLPVYVANQTITADGQQSYFGDLTVERGQVLAGNVIVYDGDVTIERDGRINGDLVVYSGDVRIRAGGGVGGNVTAFSGDVEMAGEVNGNLAAMNGDVALEDSARVNGNVSILNGDLERSEGAFVGGNVVKGPRLELPGIPAVPLPFQSMPDMAQDAISVPQRSLLQSIGAFAARVIGAGMFALLIGLIVGIIVMIKPEAVEKSRQTIVAEPALSFVAGIVANLMAVFVAVFLAITICLAPVSFVLLLIAAGFNLVGWTAIAAAAARRGSAHLKSPVRPEIAIGVAAVILTGALGLLWAMGGCFRFMGMATWFIVSSVGTGAVLLPLLRRNGARLPQPPIPHEPTPQD